MVLFFSNTKLLIFWNFYFIVRKSLNSFIAADNIVINLSQYLYEAGKTESVVIGHSTEANPNLPSTKRKKGETDKERKE